MTSARAPRNTSAQPGDRYGVTLRCLGNDHDISVAGSWREVTLQKTYPLQTCYEHNMLSLLHAVCLKVLVLFFQSVELLGVGKQGLRKKVKYCHSAWTTTVPNIFVFYSVPFYQYTKATNKALIRKAVLLKSCKHGQKSQLHCASGCLADMIQTASCKLLTLI